jgi:DNA polymerase
MFSLIYGDKAMEMLSNALRGMIIAADGKQLVVADFAAIEARVVLWLAGDVAALDEIRRGVSSYLSMGKYLFGKDITKDDNPYEYAISKATVLGAGFGMGAVRFVGNCAQNGLLVSDEMALKAIRGYRSKHKAVVDSWYANERAAANAIRTPGTIHRSCGGKVVWGMDKKREFLVCKLPSGRHLRYFKPSLVSVDTPRGEKEQIRYFTVGKEGALMQTSTYGGELSENVTQAVARDLLVNGMLNVEAAGYPVIATVHDEIISEVDSGELDSGEKSLEKFIAIMCSLPDWGKDIPVAAEGFTGRRYRK